MLMCEEQGSLGERTGPLWAPDGWHRGPAATLHVQVGFWSPNPHSLHCQSALSHWVGLWVLLEARDSVLFIFMSQGPAQSRCLVKVIGGLASFSLEIKPKQEAYMSTLLTPRLVVLDQEEDRGA